METLNKEIAHAWVLEHGKDCDGVSSRGYVRAQALLHNAKLCKDELDKWSDGNYYVVTEKWSDVLTYCDSKMLNPLEFQYCN